MKGMILAAGLGTRLRPHTELIPKPALPLFDQPLLLWAAECLRRAGITEIAVNAHHLPEVLRKACKMPGVRFHVEEETPKILGTAGGLKNLDSFFRGCGTLVMANSDIIHAMDLGLNLAQHKRNNALATMVLYDGPGHEEFPQIGVNARGAIVSFPGWKGSDEDAVVSRGSFTGIHIFNEAILDHIPAGRPSEINAEIYPKLLDTEELIMGTTSRAFWMDLGTPERFLAAQRALLDDEVSPSAAGYLRNSAAWPKTEAGRIYLSPEAKLGSGVTFGPNVCVSSKAEVGDKARLENTLLFPSARVPEGEEVTGLYSSLPVPEEDGK